ncbi:hypothetical protein L596_026211 [Steinernema carpocapsae]|uniref:Uncharacterized protein n=1 Tax=Steinernema carpocapsae TaxID=34508 RepID=A0A4U5M0S9_STECR|nr:hypothetical protein L596_026211 [Steinernema carpocapsae]
MTGQRRRLRGDCCERIKEPGCKTPRLTRWRSHFVLNYSSLWGGGRGFMMTWVGDLIFEKNPFFGFCDKSLDFSKCDQFVFDSTGFSK